jgi:hypothetical protein
MDPSDQDPNHKKPKNAEMLQQRHSIPFPTLKSNSIHSKPSEPIVPKKPRNVFSLRNKSDQSTKEGPDQLIRNGDQDGRNVRASCVPTGSPGLLLDPPSSSMNGGLVVLSGNPKALCPGQAMLASDTGGENRREIVPSVHPPTEDPPPKRSFIKRLYHRVMHPEEPHTTANTHASIELGSNLSESQAMSHVRSSRISSDPSHKTNTTDVRVAKLMEIATSNSNIDISFDKPLLDESRSSSNNYIIPPYYFNEEKMKGKLLDIDFGWTIIDSIRNLRTLTPHQLEYLQSLPSEKLIEIIHEYDHVMQTYVQSLLQDDTDT